VSDHHPLPDQEHRRDLLDGAVAPAVATVRELVDGGLVGWAQRRVAASDVVDLAGRRTGPLGGRARDDGSPA